MDFLVVLTEDVSLPDSPPVDVLALFDAFLSELCAGFFPCRLLPFSFSWSCSLRLAERVNRCSFLLSLSESEEEEEDLERLLREVAEESSFSLPSSFASPPSSLFSSFPSSEVTSVRLLLAGCLFSYVLLW